MTKHLQRDLDSLKKEILTMGALVEEATSKAIVALAERRPELAEEVQQGDDILDQKEVEVEETCLKVLALHQPVASDLRFIVAVMKVNNDLERMGDLAVNIADRTLYLAKRDPLPVPIQFATYGEKVRQMVKDSLDALVNGDPDLARHVCAADDEVDEINREVFDLVQDAMREDPALVKRAVHALSASRCLERIADSATNIAEDVIFMIEGKIVRHRLGADAASS